VVASLFVLGGARSGKSRFALARQPRTGRVAFVATAEARDADMAARIARHRAERPAHWLTVEEPRDLVARLGELAGAVDAVLVDCLTLWVSNRLLQGDTDRAILEEAEALAALVADRRCAITLVSNEVGEGVHPSSSQGLRFRDLLGLVNQRAAAACAEVTLMVAGLPLTVKAPAAGPLRDDLAHQAP
jgi:adenosylcobinamide kinase / adenosylcobinamide-phosphate guanylyltransferase